jgi:thymidylate synthase
VDRALKQLITELNIYRVFVIGGESLFRHILNTPYAWRVFATEVGGEYAYDCAFPKELAIGSPQCSPPQSKISHTEMAYQGNVTTTAYQYLFWPTPVRLSHLRHVHRETHPEDVYLDLVHRVLQSGIPCEDRTKTGTLALFGEQLRFSLREDNAIPLLTTKRVFWRGVVEELLWFIRGSTHIQSLQDRNVHFWDANGAKEFLAQRGLAYEEGDLGPIYGFQWRHFGADYTGAGANYEGRGVDQLQRCIDMIRDHPTSRRIVMSAWNAADVDKMALPPCHMMVQFNVVNGELSALMTQRSADLGLGIPFNIASYALLVRMIAHVCNLKPGELVLSLGNAHVYVNHVEGLQKQLKRTPKAFPKVTFSRDVESIDGFTADDIQLSGYTPHPRIKLDMAV